MNAVAQQVAGILATRDLKFIQSRSGNGFLLGFDSAAVELLGRDDGVPSVQIRAHLLSELSLDRAREAALMARLNDLNGEWLLPKFCYYADEGVLALEYDLIANDLHPDELVHALMLCAGHAEELDDELQAEWGGRRALERDATERIAKSEEMESIGAQPPADRSGRIGGLFRRGGG